mmetsp:Transcript_17929/g.49658  ORF Transcript_17929/g.49658 Transcript_17929/m.49658 type:complete len:1022 (-) Transcript_17929:284-3349(-)|eukprot:CAMPEP_0172373966 /NCGR_PEP_ID=MMETSP1060-20121228/53902_1 /TAXON_ID=37318 /ORGANISM="Pseudo-nitzschia pungens, Strain cf. cingulata" /LENGTH=1021 /DNA_ID=CAMNT_0013100469 /DNA_START=433 /DNA_END=3498 /DNA_ORIENTATION=+
MPSKNDDDFKQEGNQKLQAVVLADAFFGAKVTAREDYQSFGLKPWSSEPSTSAKLLCKLNNLPLVDYVVDFLASNGVEQVIFVLGACCAAASASSSTSTAITALEEHLLRSGGSASSSSSSSPSSSLEMLFLKDTSLTNAGDALRELYKRNWIRASKQAKPFLLVSGDVVADLDLTAAMDAHKARNQHDSAAVMTVVLKPANTKTNTTSSSGSRCTASGSATATTIATTINHSIVPRASELVVGLVSATVKTAATVDAQGGGGSSNINSSNNDEKSERGGTAGTAPAAGSDYRILYYDNGSSNKVGTTVPCTFLTQSQSACSTTTSQNPGGGLVLRHDLVDTGIAICSPDVLGRLEDEFDYLDLAHDFVTNSVAEEEDGLQTRIYAHVLDVPCSGTSTSTVARNYAARAVDFQTYHAISRDLLLRWAYPTVADRVLSKSSSSSNKNKEQDQRRYKLCKVADAGLSSNAAGRTKRATAAAKTSTSASSTTSAISHHGNHYQYKEILHPTKVGRTSVVHGPGMMGSRGTVGEGCLLERCVLGESVVVETGAQLIDCHLMDGVVIGAGAQLRSCVVAQNAIVRKNAVVEPGCFVGEDCVIGEEVVLPAFSRITLATEDDDDDWGDDDDGYSSEESSSDDDDEMNGKTASAISGDGAEDTDHAVVGADGKGKLWKPTLDVDVDDYDSSSLDGNGDGDALQALLQLQSIGGDPTAYYRKREARLARLEADEFGDDGFSDFDEDKDDDDDAMRTAENMAFSEFTGGTVTFGDDDDEAGFGRYNTTHASQMSAATDEPLVIGRQKGIDVVKEMTEICMEFDDECHPIENLSIELNSFKFSQNATYSDCASACLLALLRKMEVSPAMSDGKLVTLLKAKLDKFWTGMLQKLCRGVEEELAVVKALEHSALVDQQQTHQQQPPPSPGSDPEAFDAWQASTEIAQKLRSGTAFRFVLQTLHDQEVLSEDAILAWAAERRNESSAGEDDPKQALFRMPSVQAFLEWLEEDDDDSSSDEEGDSNDDSGSDDSD